MMVTEEQDMLSLLASVLTYIGEDPQRPGLRETPKRIIKAWDVLFSGYAGNPEALLKVFDCEGHKYDEVVLLRNIEFYSMCEHHFLPFFGKAHVAYIPSEKGTGIIGISKLARLVDMFSRRLQVQERICAQVVDALMTYVKPVPIGAACIIEAQHLCMLMRGVSKQNAIMVTSALGGACKTDLALRQEILKLLK